LSGCSSQTQRQLSQCAHHCITGPPGGP
jgi:hypothetical protein